MQQVARTLVRDGLFLLTILFRGRIRGRKLMSIVRVRLQVCQLYLRKGLVLSCLSRNWKIPELALA